ncbi:major facilitator superfamily domain-containing protein 12 [Nilaparvata lugens]|uniref:major facilitator superfamily domain-containing protein 12 n=1 Tax=Nilaparvata lugens TaxID=108931 RepID=UPI000B9853AB|nr:major facilitator superfamily domain-containing protein 12 [Nilaparvata lugens]XP_022189226.1 major facilitator superfamily domain-containing protein 12 [Nilaparvata lugens]
MESKSETSESKSSLSKSCKESTPLLLSAQERRQLSVLQKSAYGVGHVYNDIAAAIWFSYSLIYFQLVAETGPVLAGTFLFIGQCVDAFATPLAGFLIGLCGTKKKWHFIGSVCITVTFPLIFSTWKITRGATWSQAVYYPPIITIFQTGWAIVQIAHLSIMPEMTPSVSERAELTALRYTFSMASQIFVYLIAWVFFSDLEGMNMKLLAPKDSGRFQHITILSASIGIFCTLFFYLGSRKTWTNVTRAVKTEQEKLELSEKKRAIVFSTSIYKTAVLYTSSRLFLTLSLVYFPMFINEVVLRKSSTLATVPLVSFIASCVASMASKTVSQYCGGNRALYIAGCLICLMGTALVRMHTRKSEETWMIFIAAALFGTGSSVTMVVSLCVTANLIGDDTEIGAFIYSGVTFADKLLNGIAVITIEYMRCEDVRDCPFYYRDTLSFVNLGIAAIGLIGSMSVSSKLFRKSDTI